MQLSPREKVTTTHASQSLPHRVDRPGAATAAAAVVERPLATSNMEQRFQDVVALLSSQLHYWRSEAHRNTVRLRDTEATLSRERDEHQRDCQRMEADYNRRIREMEAAWRISQEKREEELRQQYDTTVRALVSSGKAMQELAAQAAEDARRRHLSAAAAKAPQALVNASTMTTSVAEVNLAPSTYLLEVATGEDDDAPESTETHQPIGWTTTENGGTNSMRRALLELRCLPKVDGVGDEKTVVTTVNVFAEAVATAEALHCPPSIVRKHREGDDGVEGGEAGTSMVCYCDVCGSMPVAVPEGTSRADGEQQRNHKYTQWMQFAWQNRAHVLRAAERGGDEVGDPLMDWLYAWSPYISVAATEVLPVASDALRRWLSEEAFVCLADTKDRYPSERRRSVVRLARQDLHSGFGARFTLITSAKLGHQLMFYGYRWACGDNDPGPGGSFHEPQWMTRDTIVAALVALPSAVPSHANDNVHGEQTHWKMIRCDVLESRVPLHLPPHAVRSVFSVTEGLTTVRRVDDGRRPAPPPGAAFDGGDYGGTVELLTSVTEWEFCSSGGSGAVVVTGQISLDAWCPFTRKRRRTRCAADMILCDDEGGVMKESATGSIGHRRYRLVVRRGIGALQRPPLDTEGETDQARGWFSPCVVRLCWTAQDRDLQRTAVTVRLSGPALLYGDRCCRTCMITLRSSEVTTTPTTPSRLCSVRQWTFVDVLSAIENRQEQPLPDPHTGCALITTGCFCGSSVWGRPPNDVTRGRASEVSMERCMMWIDAVVDDVMTFSKRKLDAVLLHIPSTCLVPFPSSTINGSTANDRVMENELRELAEACSTLRATYLHARRV